MKHESVNEALRALPPVGVGGLTIIGVTLNEWVMVGTLVYTVFLIVDKLPTVIERIRQFIAWVKE